MKQGCVRTVYRCRPSHYAFSSSDNKTALIYMNHPYCLSSITIQGQGQAKGDKRPRTDPRSQAHNAKWQTALLNRKP